MNVYLIDSEESRFDALKATEIKDVWGIGGQYAKFLQNYNIHTAYDFSITSDGWIKRNMSIVGLRTKQELQGKPCIELELETLDKKEHSYYPVFWTDVN